MSVLEVLDQAKELSYQERKDLVKLLIETLDDPYPPTAHSILDYGRIAAHLAREEDPATHVSRLRDEWD